MAALARIGSASLDEATTVIDRFLSDANATVVPINRATGQDALRDFARSGKGRRPAALNLGHCFAYACTRQLATTLLCNGNDVPRTDIELA